MGFLMPSSKRMDRLAALGAAGLVAAVAAQSSRTLSKEIAAAVEEGVIDEVVSSEEEEEEEEEVVEVVKDDGCLVHGPHPSKPAPCGRLRGGLTKQEKKNRDSLDRVQVLRLSSSDTAATSANVYRYLEMTGEPLVSVEVVQLQAQLRRALTHAGDGVYFGGELVEVSSYVDPDALLAHIQDLGQTIVDDSFAIARCGAHAWKASADVPFTLGFRGNLATVLGMGSFVASPAQGRYVVEPQPMDASLARVVVVSSVELGGGDEGTLASLTVESGTDVGVWDGRGDPVVLERAVETRSLTLAFDVQRVSGEPAAYNDELIAWNTVLRLGFLAPTATTLGVAVSSEVADAGAVRNAYTTGERPPGYPPWRQGYF